MLSLIYQMVLYGKEERKGDRHGQDKSKRKGLADYWRYLYLWDELDFTAGLYRTDL